MKKLAIIMVLLGAMGFIVYVLFLYLYYLLLMYPGLAKWLRIIFILGAIFLALTSRPPKE